MLLRILTVPALILAGLGAWIVSRSLLEPAGAASVPVEAPNATTGAQDEAAGAGNSSSAESPAKQPEKRQHPLGLTRNPPDPRKYLRCPDGLYAPALNGVVEPAALTWPEGRPWSPIVRKTTDADGMEWYVHADGSQTITQMTWHSQRQRMDAVTNVYNPVPTLPMSPVELAEMKKRDEEAKKSKKQGGEKGDRE